MPPETDSSTQTAEEAFEASFNDDTSPAHPADAAAAPASPAAVQNDRETSAGTDEEDELAALPPRMRTLFAKLESALPNIDQLPQLADRLRKTEGRVGDLNARVPTAPPPAPPRIEAVEVLRETLPEIAQAFDAIEERRAKEAAQASPPPSPPTQDEAPTTLLDKERPDWKQIAAGQEFDEWLPSQGAEYAEKIRRTSSEAVMLGAIERFEGYRAARSRVSNAAERVATQRQARTAGAIVPTGAAARRTSTQPITEQDAFEQAFNS